MFRLVNGYEPVRDVEMARRGEVADERRWPPRHVRGQDRRGRPESDGPPDRAVTGDVAAVGAQLLGDGEKTLDAPTLGGRKHVEIDGEIDQAAKSTRVIERRAGGKQLLGPGDRRMQHDTWQSRAVRAVVR